MEKSSKSVPRKQSKIGNTISTSPAIYWCFVLNNYTKIEKNISVPEFLNEICEKWVYGIEIGKEKQTPHLQGYCKLKRKMRFSALRKYNERIHWEKANNKEALCEYCKKDGNIMTNIKFKKLGKWNKILWKP